MLREVVAATTQQTRALCAENDKLRLLIQRLTRHQFGRRSEQLEPASSSSGWRTSNRLLPKMTPPRTRPTRPRISRGHGAAPVPYAISARCLRIGPATRW